MQQRTSAKSRSSRRQTAVSSMQLSQGSTSESAARSTPASSAEGTVLANSTDPADSFSDVCGMKILHPVDNPSVDIIYIHGLNGNRERTWTTDDGKILWPKHLLPQKIPDARVWTWGYDSRTHTYSHHHHIDVNTIHQRAFELIGDIVDERREDGTQRLPIIFIVHSLGGIILKEALLHSNGCRDGHLIDRRSVKVSTAGIIFMGTPHQGTKEVSIAQIFRHMAKIRGNTSSVLLKYLQEHNEFLEKQISDFTPISQDFEISYVYESYPTPIIGGASKLIVPHWSAVVQGALDAEQFSIKKDHVQMTKFSSLDEDGFKKMYRKLNYIKKKAGPKVENNWRVDDHNNAGLKSFRVSFSLKGTPGIKKFIPRNQEMGALENALLPEMRISKRTIFVLHGLGGLGKTQLALEFARKYQKSYSAIFWLDGRSKGTLEQSLAGIARRLPVGQIPEEVRVKEPQNQEDLTKAIEEVHGWLSQDHNEQWLLVYDNIDRDDYLEENDPEAYDIENYLPSTDQGSILITTRLQRLCSLGQDRKLCRMATNEGVELLAHQKEIRPQENLLAQQLVELVGGLPICLAQASSYMNMANSGIEGYLKLYDSTWNQLMVDQAKFHGRKKHEKSIITVWVMSYNYIKQEDKDAAQMLSLWACLDNGDIWFGLFNSRKNTRLSAPVSTLPEWYRRATSQEGDFNRIVGTLRAYSMVEAKEDLDAFAVHPVVQKWCYNNLGPIYQREFHRLATVIVGAAIPISPKQKVWPIHSRILPHIHQCCRRISLFYFEDFLGKEAQLQLFRAYYGMSVVYRILGKVKLAMFLNTLAYAGHVRKIGYSHLMTMNIVKNLANAYSCEEMLNVAKRIYKFVILILEEMSISGRATAIGTYSDLGKVVMKQGLYDEAEALFKKDLREMSLDSLGAFSTINNLTYLYIKEHNLEKWRASLFWVFVGAREMIGDGQGFIEWSFATSNLGQFYVEQGMITKGIYLCHHAIKTLSMWQHSEVVLDMARELSSLFRKELRDTEADALSQWAENPKAKDLDDVLQSPLVVDCDESRLIEGKLTPEQFKSMYEEAHKRFKEVTGF